jgi:hypothetical protein
MLINSLRPKKPETAIPRGWHRCERTANAAVSAGLSERGAPRVIVHMAVIDGWNLSDHLASLLLNPLEARDMADRLVRAAAQAEAWEKEPPIDKNGLVRFMSRPLDESTAEPKEKP